MVQWQLSSCDVSWCSSHPSTDYEPQLPGGANGVSEEATKGSKLLTDEPDPSKFEGEDEEPDRPKWQVPQSQAKKVVPSKYDESRGVYVDDDTPLDDPIAEKLRKQRCGWCNPGCVVH